MTKRQRKQTDKNTMRDSLTNKRVGSKEVIWVGNAIDYVKKQGYLVIKPRTINELEFIVTYGSMIIMLIPLIFRMGAI
jgi:hypothetical protein